MTNPADQLRVAVTCGARPKALHMAFAMPLALACRIPADLDPFECELAFLHSGSHIAFVAATHKGECWWWLRWGPVRPEVVQANPCNARSADDCWDDCLLPEHHAGRHSFDVEVKQVRAS